MLYTHTLPARAALVFGAACLAISTLSAVTADAQQTLLPPPPAPAYAPPAHAYAPNAPQAPATQFGLRVVNVAPNDVLNMREYPTSSARIVDIIPPAAGGVLYSGEQQGDWLFVRYGKSTGWVHRRYVVPEVAGWISRGERR